MVIDMAETVIEMLKRHDQELVELQKNCKHIEYDEILKPLEQAECHLRRWSAFCKNCGKLLRHVTDHELFHYRIEHPTETLLEIK
jgi:aspartyl/asparaginyl-tRNA synthetase